MSKSARRPSNMPGLAAALVVPGQLSSQRLKKVKRRPHSAPPSGRRASPEPPPPDSHPLDGANGRKPRPPRLADCPARPSPFARSTPVEGRKPWDDSPHRARPPALRGLLLHDPIMDPWLEPFARDEATYHKRFSMWSTDEGRFDAMARHPFLPERLRMAEIRKTDYMGRWNNKFVAMGTQIGGQHESGGYVYNNYDGNPFT
mmetsp:Transcript_69506/g.137836  ORF Transcript_69506/g.137836 Transcript_69506/m.137836 type:complete len:202 (-) Transcript_69506:478-1083(-)